MVFDLSTAPASAEALAEEARRCEAAIADGERRLKGSRWMLLAVAGLTLFGVSGMWWMTVIPVGVVAGAAGVAAVAVTLAVAAGAAGGEALAAAAGAVAAVVAAAVAVEVPVAAGVAVAIATTLYIDKLKAGIEQARSSLGDLDVLAPAQCPQVLTWCQAHAELAAYQSQVVGKGRFLVRGEAHAMENWVAKAASRAESERLETVRREACLALKEPVIIEAVKAD